MRLKIVLVASALLTACTGNVRHAASTDDASLSEKLIAQEKASWVAWKARDSAFFASFLSQDHIEIGPGGPVGKQPVVDFVGSPACVVENYTVDQFHMTRIGADTAVLVYHAAQKTVCGGVAVPSPVWATSVYVERDGRWLNALYQHSPAAR